MVAPIAPIKVPVTTAPTDSHTHATPKEGLATPKNIALGAIAVTAVVGGGVLGMLRGSPLKGLGIGAAIATVAIGAALLGNAGASQRDGWCDSYGDPDCDYPGTTPRPYYPPTSPYYPPTYPTYPSYPSYPDPSYPGGGYGGYPGGGYGGTSPGDD